MSIAKVGDAVNATKEFCFMWKLQELRMFINERARRSSPRRSPGGAGVHERFHNKAVVHANISM